MIVEQICFKTGKKSETVTDAETGDRQSDVTILVTIYL